MIKKSKHVDGYGRNIDTVTLT